MNRVLFSLLIGCCASTAWAQSGSISVSHEHGKVESTTTVSNNAAARSADRFCLRDTGSHISSHLYSKSGDGRKYTDCVNANGRVYTREDLERTGASNTADALRRLDPSIR